MKPPYTITGKILRLVASISEKIGEINVAHLYKPPTELRKKNRIQTIHSSLQIEGNMLTIGQVTAILEHKKVAGPEKDILEVKNAIRAYERMNNFKPNSLTSFCKAHRILMKGLLESPGKLRSRSVGIVKGSELAHIAPKGEIVKALMNNLFKYLKHDKDISLIKSCVFHYEVEFIHPFLDGNGRMGRLWQTVILRNTYPVFEFLPIEQLIKEKQVEYYISLEKSDKTGQSTPFIEFMLGIINKSLEEMLNTQNISLTSMERMELFRTIAKKGSFTRKDFLRQFKEISTATASRDLKLGAKNKIIKKTGDKNLAKYKFIARKPSPF